MMQVSNLSKIYQTPRGPLTIFSEVSFSLAPGDAAAIMGPSGSGKSSLLYVLGGLEPPTAGRVTVGGRDPFALSRDELAAYRNQTIGFVFQDHCLLPQCTVLENVLIPTLVAASRGAGDKREFTMRARELVAEVGLADRVDHRPGELSGGERQRVAIARALIRRPTLLLCDEPTGNLDQASADIVSALLLDLQRRQPSILMVVTHSPALASKFPIRFELARAHLSRVPDVQGAGN
jgi:lipoprotein-releasing system ATP-binding protein